VRIENFLLEGFRLADIHDQRIPARLPRTGAPTLSDVLYLTVLIAAGLIRHTSKKMTIGGMRR
jgi:hypothetical protein